MWGGGRSMSGQKKDGLENNFGPDEKKKHCLLHEKRTVFFFVSPQPKFIPPIWVEEAAAALILFEDLEMKKTQVMRQKDLSTSNVKSLAIVPTRHVQQLASHTRLRLKTWIGVNVRPRLLL